MIFCSKFTKTITSSALLAGVASSSFVSAYDTKLRRRISCNEDKDISSNGSNLEDLTKKDVTNGDDENLVEDDKFDGYKDNYRVHKDNRSSYEDTDSVDKVPTVNKHETEKSVISKLKDNKLSSESDLLKSLNLKTVTSIISASSSIGILGGLAKKIYSDKKVNPTKPDDPEPHIKDDDKNKDNPDPHEKEKKKDEPEPHIKDDDKNKDNPDPNEKEKKKEEPGPSPVALGNENSNKKYILITLGVFGLAALVVMFLYRTRIMIKVLGWEKYVEKFHSSWDDWQKRLFYRKIFGYKGYIEKFPDDWWLLYKEEKFVKGLEVFSKETVEVFYLLRIKMDFMLAKYGTRVDVKKSTEIGTYSDLEEASGWLEDLYGVSKKISYTFIKNFISNNFQLELIDGELFLSILGKKYKMVEFLETIKVALQRFYADQKKDTLMSEEKYVDANSFISAFISFLDCENYKRSLVFSEKHLNYDECTEYIEKNVISNNAFSKSDAAKRYLKEQFEKIKKIRENYLNNIDEAEVISEKLIDEKLINVYAKNHFIYNYIFGNRDELLKNYPFEKIKKIRENYLNNIDKAKEISQKLIDKKLINVYAKNHFIYEYIFGNREELLKKHSSYLNLEYTGNNDVQEMLN